MGLWSVVVLLLLDNLGIDITALVAGLGIGGVAVALAVQNILGDLLISRIRNFGRMRERRVLFKVGVTYQTPRDRLEAIPGLIREAVEASDNTRFDRSHFSEYGDFSLNFETVYYVLSSDYNAYMDVQQAIYLRIHEAFEQAGIEFAYPTQTLYLERQAPGA